MFTDVQSLEEFFFFFFHATPSAWYCQLCFPQTPALSQADGQRHMAGVHHMAERSLPSNGHFFAVHLQLY